MKVKPARENNNTIKPIKMYKIKIQSNMVEPGRTLIGSKFNPSGGRA